MPRQRRLIVVEFVWRHSIAKHRKPLVICKDLRRDISYTRRVIADFVPNFAAMATGVGRGRICLASFNSPTPKTPVRRKHLWSYTSRVIADFVPKFVAMATGLVVAEFVWHHSIAHPRIPPTRRKRHHNIFYTSRVIACFVSNFVAMATRVGRCKIWLTSFDSPTSKTPC